MMVEVRFCGGQVSPHVGEELTAVYLRQHLPGGVLLANYYLPDPPGMLEMDVVVVNQNGVYVLEVKHWWGKIEAYPDYWRHVNSGEKRANPTPGVQRKASVLFSWLKKQGWSWVSVKGFTVLSKGLNLLERSPSYNYADWEFALDQKLLAALTGRQYVHDPRWPRLSSAQIQRLADTLFAANQSAGAVQLFGFRVTGRQERGYYTDLTAEDIEMPGRQVRIKAYRLPEISSGVELETAVKQFKRDMNALLQAGSHPNLVYPLKFLRDPNADDGYFLILEKSGEQTLADRLAAGPLPLAQQWPILQDVAAALAHCHQQGVVHRNLSPTSVYLAANGRAKVGDFDFARVPVVSHTYTRSMLDTAISLLAGRHVAPEQKLNLHTIDERADVFALGALWYDMLFAPPPDAPLAREQIQTAPMTEAARRFCLMLVAEGRQERPSSMADIYQTLRDLEVANI